MSNQLQPVDMETPQNTDLAAPIDTQQAPTGVSPLVAMLASGQLTAELVDQALELQEKHDNYEAKKLFNIAISNFRSVVTNIVKDQSGHNSKYASLGAIARGISEPLGANGLSYYWTQAEDQNITTVTCHLAHAAGHSIETSMSSAPDTSGKKEGIQAKASAISYLRRYTLTSLLGIATEDDDGQAAAANSAKQTGPSTISDKDFDAKWPQWVDLVTSGKKPGMRIMTQVGNKYRLTETQTEKLATLPSYEPDGETA